MLWKIFRMTKIYVQSIVGTDNIPSGPFIVAANHEGPFDSAFIMAALKKDVRFVAARHLLSAEGLIGWYHRNILFSLGQSIPTGEQCIENCQTAINRGETVGIFPEGDIHPKLRMPRIHTGAIVLSQLAQVPILPVRINGSSRIWPIFPLWKFSFWRVKSVKIYLGKTIPPLPSDRKFSKEEYQKLSDQLMRSIFSL